MDEESMRRLCHFGLYNEEYAKAKGLEPFSSHEESAGSSLYWDWSLSQSLAERSGSDAIATKLAEQSSLKISHIPFTEFVRRAYGLPSPAIEGSLRVYDFIELKIYRTFTRNLQHLGLLVELKQVSRRVS